MSRSPKSHSLRHLWRTGRTGRCPQLGWWPDHLHLFLGELGARPKRTPGAIRSPSDDHKKRSHPQHADFLAAGAAVADPHPHPVPPSDFSSASSAQQAPVPDGAGPPQQVCGASPCASDVSAAPRFVVFD
jgi:hypothetical protein